METVKSLASDLFWYVFVPIVFGVGMLVFALKAQQPGQGPPGVVHNGPTGHNHGHQYPTDVILVPLIQKVYANSDAFYSSRRTYQEEQRDKLIDMLADAFTIIKEERAAAGGGTTPTAKAGGGGTKAALTAALKGCVGCHSPAGGNKGDLDLSDPDTVTREGTVACLDAILEKRMPKGGGSVSPEHKTVFKKWAAGLIK